VLYLLKEIPIGEHEPRNVAVWVDLILTLVEPIEIFGAKSGTSQGKDINEQGPIILRGPDLEFLNIRLLH
jgi:hypothetical protein